MNKLNQSLKRVKELKRLIYSDQIRLTDALEELLDVLNDFQAFRNQDIEVIINQHIENSPTLSLFYEQIKTLQKENMKLRGVLLFQKLGISYSDIEIENILRNKI